MKDARYLAYVEDQRDILTDAVVRANNLFNEAMTQQIEYLRRVYFRGLEVDKEKLRLLSEKANEAYIARKMAEAGLGEHLDSFFDLMNEKQETGRARFHARYGTSATILGVNSEFLFDEAPGETVEGFHHVIGEVAADGDDEARKIIKEIEKMHIKAAQTSKRIRELDLHDTNQEDRDNSTKVPSAVDDFVFVEGETDGISGT